MGISLHLGGFRVWMGVCMDGWQIGVQNGTERGRMGKGLITNGLDIFWDFIWLFGSFFVSLGIIKI